MLKVRINRANWACGGRYSKHNSLNYSGNSLYDSETGGMCCLGFAVNQLCNVSLNRLDGRVYPSDINDICPSDQVTKMFEFVDLTQLRQFERKAVKINDESRLAYTKREKQLHKLFEKFGIKLEFYGEYTK